MILRDAQFGAVLRMAADWNYFKLTICSSCFPLYWVVIFSLLKWLFFQQDFNKISFFFAILILFLACLLLWMSCYHLWYSLEVTLFYLNDFESGAREQFHALGVTPVNFEGGGSRFKTWRTPFRWLREVTIIHNHQNQGYSFKSILKPGIKMK